MQRDHAKKILMKKSEALQGEAKYDIGGCWTGINEKGRSLRAASPL